MRVQTLASAEVDVVAAIDRSEHVDHEYAVVDGRLTPRPATMSEVPGWDPEGTGPHSIAAQLDFCRQRLAAGGCLLAVRQDDDMLGAAIVEPEFDDRIARLAFLYVDRRHRRNGVAGALWEAALTRARVAGARVLYISAAPTASAIGFYLRQGCVLADPPHPVLLDEEPDDIHLVFAL